MFNHIDVKYFKLCAPEIGKETAVDISAKCPVCGDSKTGKKHRLHLYERDGLTLVKCFNCGLHNNMYNFIKNYFPNYLFNYKKECFQNNLFFKETFEIPKEDIKENDLGDELKFETDLDSLDCGLDFSEVKEKLKVNENQNNFPENELPQNFKYFKSSFMSSIENDENIYNYLLSRKIKYSPEIFGEFKIFKQDLNLDNRIFKLYNSIIIPFYCNNFKDMYGFYSRDISKKDFRTCNLNTGYKIWNWFNIDKDKEVYIFEGIFDALSFYTMYNEKNIIALCTNDIEKERLQELKYPIFCLDNDKTGINTMLKYVMKHKCIMYDNLKNLDFKDFNDVLCNNIIPKNIEFVNSLEGMVRLKKCL